jgi:hypothetical protein
MPAAHASDARLPAARRRKRERERVDSERVREPEENMDTLPGRRTKNRIDHRGMTFTVSETGGGR